jgi:GAF domain-containing protein
MIEKLSSDNRLQALRATGLLDSPRDDQFDQLTRLAANILRVPNALVTLVSGDRQYVKSNSDIAEGTLNPAGSSQSLDLSFCRHAVASEQPFLVEDAREHPLVRDSGAVAAGVISYAGVPLSFEGQSIGALCVIDSQPRQWSDEDVQALRTLARSAMQLMAENSEARTAQLGSLTDQPSSLVECLSAHLRSLKEYEQLITTASVDLDREARSRHQVNQTLELLKDCAEETGSAADPELHRLICDYNKSEQERSEATSDFTGGKITLQELQAKIIHHDDALHALRLAALDRGAEI